MTSCCTSYDSWSDIRHNILIQGESFCNNKCPSSFKSSSNHWPSCCWGCRCQAVRIDKTKAAYLYTYINSIYWCIKFRKLYGRGVNCFSSVCLQKSHQSISCVTRIVCIIDLNRSKNHEGRSILPASVCAYSRQPSFHQQQPPLQSLPYLLGPLHRTRLSWKLSWFVCQSMDLIPMNQIRFHSWQILLLLQTTWSQMQI